jgi:hypothetical protein
MIKAPSIVHGTLTRFDHEHEKPTLKRDHEESEDDDAGRTIFNKKQKTATKTTKSARTNSARIEAETNSKGLGKPNDGFSAVGRGSYDMNTMRSSLPAITMQSSVPPQTDPKEIRATDLQAAIFDDTEHDGRSLFVAQPNLSNKSAPTCTARDVIDGLRGQQRNSPSGIHLQRLPSPLEVQQNLFGFKVTWPTRTDAELARRIPIQLYGVGYNFQSSSSTKGNGIVGKLRKSRQTAVIAGPVKEFGADQIAIGEMHYRGVFTGRYWVRMLQPRRLSKSRKECICSKDKKGFCPICPAKSDVCNVCEEPLSDSCKNCAIIPIKHPDLCSSFL